MFCSSGYQEFVEFSGGFAPGNVLTVDPTVVRTPRRPVAKCLKILSRSLGQDPHRSIRPVSHPAGQSQGHGLCPGVPSEGDTLHTTMDGDFDSDFQDTALENIVII
jgi:hypothetical protein